MVSAAPAVFDPGRPPALHPATCHAPPVHSTSFTSKNNPIQQEMMVYPTNSPSSTHGTVRALRKHLSFFESFAPTPRRCYHVDPLDEALHLRPCNLFYLEPITFAYPFSFKNPAPPQGPIMNKRTPSTPPWTQPSLTLTQRRPTKPHRYYMPRSSTFLRHAVLLHLHNCNMRTSRVRRRNPNP